MNTKQTNLLEADLYYRSLSRKDQFLLESYVLIGENIDVNNTYEYIQDTKNMWSFRDKNGIEHVTKLNYNPGTTTDILNVKIFWMNEKTPSYEKPPYTDEKVFNTHLKILVDQILPKLSELLNHFKLDKLVFDATDAARYRLYRSAISSILDTSKYTLEDPKESNLLYLKLK